eukprot:4548001-Pyramimonas_sp.AAC.1
MPVSAHPCGARLFLGILSNDEERDPGIAQRDEVREMLDIFRARSDVPEAPAGRHAVVDRRPVAVDGRITTSYW